jgi:hypothetical protein
MMLALVLLLALTAAANAYLAVGIGGSPRLVYHARADVDGEDRSDRITLRTVQAGASGGRLEVALASGRVLEVRTPSDAPYLPGLVAVANVDGRPGEELFVDVEHITTDEVIAVYTYAGGSLRLGGTLPPTARNTGSCSVSRAAHKAPSTS